MLINAIAILGDILHRPFDTDGFPFISFVLTTIIFSLHQFFSVFKFPGATDVLVILSTLVLIWRSKLHWKNRCGVTWVLC